MYTWKAVGCTPERQLGVHLCNCSHYTTTEVTETALRTRKAVGEARPLAFLNHLSFLLYTVLKWAGLRFRRLFTSPFCVAKGVSVISVVNCFRLISDRQFWYHTHKNVANCSPVQVKHKLRKRDAAQICAIPYFPFNGRRQI